MVQSLMQQFSYARYIRYLYQTNEAPLILVCMIIDTTSLILNDRFVYMYVPDMVAYHWAVTICIVGV